MSFRFPKAKNPEGEGSLLEQVSKPDMEDVHSGEKMEKESVEKEKETEPPYEYLDIAGKNETSGEGVKFTVLEEGHGYKIIRRDDEETPVYMLSLPVLDSEDKKILKRIEKMAIGEIRVDPDLILDSKSKKDTFVREIVKLIESRYRDVPEDKRRVFADFIVQNMVGYGLLDPLLENDRLEEVMVVGTEKSVYVYHRKHGMCRTNVVFEEDAAITNIISKIARSVGRRVDISSPLLDARLPDGSRVNATMPPASLDGPSLTIRKFQADPLTIVDIIKFGTLDPELASFLWLITEGYGVKPANVLVSGGTGSGKTTTLNCLGSFIPTSDRVISIEDTAELQLPVEHWIRLETRPPNVEGKGEVNMDMLLKNTLRMRPDRIVVGEVRGAEAVTLLAAMNTGQNGCLGTLHANTAKETVTRLTSEPMSVPLVMIPSLNLILMQNRFTYRGKVVRRITEIAEITGSEGKKVKINILCVWDPKDDAVKPTGVPSVILWKLAELRGVSVQETEEEMKRRRSVLEYLVENDIRSIGDVGTFINEYYTSPDAIMSKIESENGTSESQADESKGRYSFLDSIIGEREKTKVGIDIQDGKSCKVIKNSAKKSHVYTVPLPQISPDEKRILVDIEKRAIDEIKVDPSKVSKDSAEGLFVGMVLDIIEKYYSSKTAPSKRKAFANIVVWNMIGYGILEVLLKDDNLEEIMVVGTKKPVYVNHREYGISKTTITFDSDEECIRIIEKIANSIGRRIDKASPLLDARLLDGSRVNATIPPLSIQGPTITIRKFKKDPLTVVDLINFGTLSPNVAAYLWLVVDGFGIKPGNILAAGGSGCGKTTTLNCMCSFIPSTDRVITIEDTAELRLPIEHCIRLETRPPNVEDVGELDMDDLVKNTLRMRPDRIIVGEVRGGEARTLFTAMNTGHDGCMGTVHANSAKECIIRLTNPPMRVPEVMLPALDLILMQSKIHKECNTVRRIIEIAETSVSENEKLVLNNVYLWDPKTDSIKVTDAPSVLKQKIARLRGVSVEDIDAEIKRRESVLSWMVEKNIRNIDDVAKIFTRYYVYPEKLLKEIMPGV